MKVKFSNREEKVRFLKGLQEGSRSLNELREDDPLVVTISRDGDPAPTKEEIDKAVQEHSESGDQCPYTIIDNNKKSKNAPANNR